MSAKTISDLKNAQILEKDDAIKTIINENENLGTRLKEMDARCNKLSTAFDSVSNLQKISADENWRLKVTTFLVMDDLFIIWLLRLLILFKLNCI